jgi:hypothetical protein
MIFEPIALTLLPQQEEDAIMSDENSQRITGSAPTTTSGS